MVNTKTAINQKQPQHCVIHVHGLQHTGTGFLRQQIRSHVLHGRASRHSKTIAPQDEGQHLQDVYPSLRTRGSNLSLCGLRKGEAMHVGRLYYCPELVETIPQKPGSKEELWKSWSQHWNMSQPFLIQKTTSLDGAKDSRYREQAQRPRVERPADERIREATQRGCRTQTHTGRAAGRSQNHRGNEPSFTR